MIKFDEVSYKIKVLKDPTLKKSNMFMKMISKLNPSSENVKKLAKY